MEKKTMNNFEEKTKKQGTSKPEASNEKVNGDMAWEEELERDDVQLDDVQLDPVVGGAGCDDPGGYYSWTAEQQQQYRDQRFRQATGPIGGYSHTVDY